MENQKQEAYSKNELEESICPYCCFKGSVLFNGYYETKLILSNEKIIPNTSTTREIISTNDFFSCENCGEEWDD